MIKLCLATWANVEKSVLNTITWLRDIAYAGYAFRLSPLPPSSVFSQGKVGILRLRDIRSTRHITEQTVFRQSILPLMSSLATVPAIKLVNRFPTDTQSSFGRLGEGREFQKGCTDKITPLFFKIRWSPLCGLRTTPVGEQLISTVCGSRPAGSSRAEPTDQTLQYLMRWRNPQVV